jgi:tRNA wybutosine-synthesizing protein 2
MRVRMIRPSDLPGITGQQWVDQDRRPWVREGVAYVPVREGEPHDRILPERKPYRGRGYQRLGDLVLLHGDRPTPGEVKEILAWARPRGILWLRGISGRERIPDTELLFGTAGEVCHREYGCSFVLDPARVMYAVGNLSERRRMVESARSTGNPGRVGDLFAGIGYFTIPAARAGAPRTSPAASNVV